MTKICTYWNETNLKLEKFCSLIKHMLHQCGKYL